MAGSSNMLPYEIASTPGESLNITINKDFDFGQLHQDWAQSIVTMYPGPYSQVRVDLSHCNRVSSTFFAGLVHLNNTYKSSEGKKVVLVKPDPRLLHNLTMLRLNTLFAIEPR